MAKRGNGAASGRTRGSAATAELLELIDLVYRSAEDPGIWPRFLDRLQSTLRSGTTSFLVGDWLNNAAGVSAMVGKGAERVDEYNSYWGRHDPYWLAKNPIVNIAGRVYTSQDLVADDVVLRCAAYNEYFRELDVFYGAYCTVAAGSETTALLACNFSREQGPPTREQLRTIHLLAPHLRRAVALHRRLRGAQLTNAAFDDVLERLPIAFVLLHEDGRIARLNGVAAKMLRTEDGLTSARGRLAAQTNPDDARLQQAIARALRMTMRGEADTEHEILLLSRASGKQPYEVVVTPLSINGDLFGRQRAAAVVLIHDRDARPATDLELLRSRFGLTATEADLVVRLLSGLEPNQIAEQLRKSKHTVRFQLKSLYGKLGVSGRAQLIRVLTSSLVSWHHRATG
jgi:DNA-binding CsgD family transcriptional regulator/PAS domain-containing protein